jgi:hypothetical protein
MVSAPNTLFSGNVRSMVVRGWLRAPMGLTGDASRHLLLAPEFWLPRIERLEREPRQLAIFPRSDLSRPGIDVVELRLRAHDGARLEALLARSSFAGIGQEVCLHSSEGLEHAVLDFKAVEMGSSDLVFQFPPDRRLEDRVLDVLRIVDAACSLEGVDCSRLKFQERPCGVQDEFAIVRFIRKEGWIGKRPAAS